MRDASQRHGRVLPTVKEFFDTGSVSRPLSLRFRDRDLEDAFQADYYRDNLFFIRFAHVVGVGIWFGFFAVAAIAHTPDLVGLSLRILAGLAVVLTSLVCSYTRWFPPRWSRVVATAHILTALVLIGLYLQISSEDPAADWGYAAVMGLMAFTFFVSRLQMRIATVVAVGMILGYDLLVIPFTDDTFQQLLYANYFLLAFVAVNTVAAYSLERATRLLWLRERDVDRERRRADELLANTLPAAIIGHLKAGSAPGSDTMASDHDDVTVLFADLVSFTAHAGAIAAADLVAVLDEVFTRFDALASQLGVEKVKTVGDAYLAVAGAPEPRADHASAVAALAIAMHDSVARTSWSTGEPIQLRIGIATGSVVAGVIGRSRFAYDLWGDTVNLASRLQTTAQPGTTLVSETTAAKLDGAYRLSDPIVLQLKGKGPTAARFLSR